MGRKVQAWERAGRPVMRSPGRPPVGRLEHRQRFWAAIARGASSEAAAAQAGVLGPVGVRWFREGGGMPTVTLAAPSGRYLSFAEREEIALLRVAGCGVRELARRLRRLARKNYYVAAEAEAQACEASEDAGLSGSCASARGAVDGDPRRARLARSHGGFSPLLGPAQCR